MNGEVFYPQVTHQIGGNTSGATANISSGTMYLAGGNNVTLSQNANSVTISAGAGGGGGVTPAISGSNGSFSFSTATFGSSNGMHFYTTNGSLVGSYTVPTQSVQTQNMVSVNGSTGNISLATGSSLSSSSNGSTITFGLASNITTALQSAGAYLTTAMASNTPIVQSINGSSGTFSFMTGSSLSSSRNANSITWGLASNITTALQSAGAYLTTARASNDAIGLNTAQSNVTWTANSSGLSLDARGYAGTGTTGTNATFTLNSNGLQLNAGAYLTTAMASNRGTDFVQANAAFAGTNASGTIASNGISVSVNAGGGATPVASASNGSFSFTTLGFSNANNVTFGTSAGSIITASVAAPGAAAENNWFALTGANTAGNTTASGSTIGLSGINLTLSGTNGSGINISAPATSSLSATGLVSLSTNGSTISIGVADKTFSNWEVFQDGNNSTYSSMGQNSLYIQKLKPEENYSFANFELRMSGSIVSSTNSQVAAHSIRYGLYSMDTNNSYNSIATSLMAMTASFNSSTAIGFTVSQGAGSYTITTNNSSMASVYTGLKHLYLPFAGSMSAGGSYAFMYHISSATTVGTSPMRMAILQHTNINNLTVGKIYGSTVSVSNSTFVGDYAQGVLTATTSAMPSAVAKSQMTNQVSQARVYLQLDS